MSEMLTRVGGAILLAESQWSPKSGVSKERAMAIAAIEAMREPTEEMIDAGQLLGEWAIWNDPGSNAAKEVWRVMNETSLK